MNKEVCRFPAEVGAPVPNYTPAIHNSVHWNVGHTLSKCKWPNTAWLMVSAENEN